MSENNETKPWWSKDESQGNEGSQTTFNPNVYFNPSLKNGETQKTFKIRILPPLNGETSPFMTRQYHKVTTQKLDFNTKKIISGEVNVNCGGKDCPLCAYGTELWKKHEEAKKAGEEETANVFKAQAIQFFQKTAYVARIIDRDNEDHGVKFWAFDKMKTGGTYDLLTDLAEEAFEEEKVDYTDPEKGFDIKLKKYVGKSVMPSLDKQQPLSKNQEKKTLWLSETRTVADVWKDRRQHNEWLKFIVGNKACIWSKDNNEWVEWIPRDQKEDTETDTKPTPEFKKLTVEESATDDLPF